LVKSYSTCPKREISRLKSIAIWKWKEKENIFCEKGQIFGSSVTNNLIKSLVKYICHALRTHLPMPGFDFQLLDGELSFVLLPKIEFTILIICIWLLFKIEEMIFEQPFFATFVTTFSLIFTLFFYFLSITLIFVSISHFFCKILIVAKVVTDMNVQITQLHWLWCIHGYVDSFLTHSLYHIHTICNCYSYIGSLQFKCDYLKDLKDKPLIWVFKLQVCDG